MKKKLLLLVALFTFTGSMLAQNIGFQDPGLLTALVNHVPAIDTDGDFKISVQEANAFTGTLDISNHNISDLTGIQYFINIDQLHCQGNNLTTLSLKSNINLEQLFCQNNKLTSVDISKNTLLEVFAGQNNKLQSLDLSLNTQLRDVKCYNNELTSLNVKNRNNTNITTMVTHSNSNLYCIQVDDSTWSADNWDVNSKDAGTQYNEDCSAFATAEYAIISSVSPVSTGFR